MPLEELLLVALGFGVGAYGTIIGAGGGFVLVPALLLLFPEYGPEKVTSISLAVIWANATSGSLAYARQRRIDYLTGLLFSASSTPGVVGGALLVHLVPERAFSILFALLLLAALSVLLRSPSTAIREPRSGQGVLVRTVVMPDGVTYRYGYKVWQGVLLSLGVGFASSLFGIGGGLIHVPTMIVLFGIPVQFAAATSHFILSLMTAGATIIHVASGTFHGAMVVQAVALGAGAVPGAQLGAWIAHRVRGRTVVAMLSVAVLVLAVRLLTKGILNV